MGRRKEGGPVTLLPSLSHEAMAPQQHQLTWSLVLAAICPGGRTSWSAIGSVIADEGLSDHAIVLEVCSQLLARRVPAESTYKYFRLLAGIRHGWGWGWSTHQGSFD